MEENENGFAEFEEAFSGDYQNAEPETAEEPEAQETTDIQDEQEETADSESGGEAEESPEGQEDGNADTPPEAEAYTLKVNKEERTVNRDEVIALAQKGFDYDRVKEQLTESRTENQELRGRIGRYQDAISALEDIATASGQTVDQLVEQMQINMLVKGGKTEPEARAELRAQKAEAQLKAARDRENAQKTAAESTQARAQREVEEFRKKYPDVELSEELCRELAPDVQKGTSLTEAYQNRELRRKDAEIAELKRKQEAEMQNTKNRKTSTGSQRDSGGRREKSDFDDFMSAFE